MKNISLNFPASICVAICCCLASVVLTSCRKGGGSDDPVLEPKFSVIQKKIFNESCDASSCHGSGMKGGLGLMPGQSYAQLISIPGTADKHNTPSFPRVKPGSPDSSFLLIKLVAPDSDQGEIMPKGNDRLSPHQIDAIRQWILAGAPEN